MDDLIRPDLFNYILSAVVVDWLLYGADCRYLQ